MKRFARILAALVLALGSIAMAGCDPQTADTKGIFRFVVGEETPVEYTVDLAGVDVTEGVLSVIKYLHETEGLEYAAETGAFGAFLTKVGGVEQDAAAGIYLYVFTSVEKDFDVSAYAVTRDYDGTTLCSAGVGVSEMTVEKDCIVYIGTIAL